MTDAGAPPDSPSDSFGKNGPSSLADDERNVGVSTTNVLAGARRRLAENPGALVALLVAGAVVAGGDWLHLHDPVPATEYEGVQQGRVAFPFGLAVTVLSRATVPPSALLHLKTGWLASTVGIELAGFVAVVVASSYALARLLAVRLALRAIIRYGLLVAFVQYGVVRLHFEGGAALVGIPLVVALTVAMVRLVPFPGRLVLGEPFGTAIRRSWASTRGDGWALLGVVLLVGLANHLLVSVPVVGPLGSAVAGAVHAGVVATVVARTRPPT